MYKELSKLKERFQTNRGLLSVEQLWDLSLADLDALAVKLESEYKNSKGKSFLLKKNKKDKTIKLKFDVVLDILTSKIEDAELLSTASENKAHNQKILNLIADKLDENLKELSVNELEKLMK